MAHLSATLSGSRQTFTAQAVAILSRYLAAKFVASGLGAAIRDIPEAATQATGLADGFLYCNRPVEGDDRVVRVGKSSGGPQRDDSQTIGSAKRAASLFPPGRRDENHDLPKN